MAIWGFGLLLFPVTPLTFTFSLPRLRSGETRWFYQVATNSNFVDRSALAAALLRCPEFLLPRLLMLFLS